MCENTNIMRTVFWNVKNKNLTELVCGLANSSEADVLVLNENSEKSSDTLHALKKHVSPDFEVVPTSGERRFQVYSRLASCDVSEIHSGFRVSARQLLVGGTKSILILVHGVDPMNYDQESRQAFAQSLATEIAFIKDQQRTDKIIILGDFNMNPYDRGMNLATGLNAMMTKSCVIPRKRQHLNQSYDLYYNPMWSLLGDNTSGPPGTIYDTSSRGPYGWSMFDQVLVSHSMVQMFLEVNILTEAGNVSLMNRKGRPNKDVASDHFPLLVRFKGA